MTRIGQEIVRRLRKFSEMLKAGEVELKTPPLDYTRKVKVRYKRTGKLPPIPYEEFN